MALPYLLQSDGMWLAQYSNYERVLVRHDALVIWPIYFHLQCMILFQKPLVHIGQLQDVDKLHQHYFKSKSN